MTQCPSSTPTLNGVVLPLPIAAVSRKRRIQRMAILLHKEGGADVRAQTQSSCIYILVGIIVSDVVVYMVNNDETTGSP